MLRGAAIEHANIIYTIGGGSHTVYSYRLDRDEWSEHSQCPHVNPGLIMINNQLTAVGGEKEDIPTNKLVSWNDTEWVVVFPPMHTPRAEPALVHHSNYIIAMGGDSEHRGVEIFNISSHIWSTVASLPTPLQDITAMLCHNDIVAMARDGSVYSITTDSLISATGVSAEPVQWMPLPRCPVTWGPTLTTFHGQTPVVQYCGIYQLYEGQWVRIGGMPVPMYYCIVCVVCDHMVVVGGHDSILRFASTNAVRVAISE